MHQDIESIIVGLRSHLTLLSSGTKEQAEIV